MQKRSLDAYNCIIETVLKKILQYNIKFVILKIEGLNNIYLSLFTKQILLLSNKSSLAIVGLKYIKKISHNGCRLKY